MDNVRFTVDFNPVKKEEWLEKIKKDLRGKPFESLLSKTDYHSPTKPALNREDLTDEMKAFHPALLEIKPENTWKIRQVLMPASISLLDETLNTGADRVEIPMHAMNEKNKLSDCIEVQVKGNDTIEPKVSVRYWTDPIGDFLSGYAPGLDVENTEPLNLNYRVRAYLLHEAGAHAVYELASMLSWAYEYMVFAKVRTELEIELAVGIDFFPEVAKFRAARLLLHRLAEVANFQGSIVLSARTSSYYAGHRDTYTNLLRNTTMGLAAVLGGADVIEIQPHVKPATQMALRLARNIHHLLRDESFYDKVADPIGGSYSVEYLTAEIIHTAWKDFKRIEADGGWIVKCKQEEIPKELKQQHQDRLMRYREKQAEIIGVSIFQNPEEDVEQVEKSIVPYPGPHCITLVRLATEIKAS
jgi:methylmalonyl-CoA mutase